MPAIGYLVSSVDVHHIARFSPGYDNRERNNVLTVDMA
ncbi:hypothetical protein AC062_0468 [Pasteurellaceae bacterium NI1060]|nr:hypothetical protein AC062_0468 [Pasteurellaceae bacterium NI1060]